jgi:hypothetical protein
MIGLMLLGVLLSTRLRESTLIRTAGAPPK